MQPSDDMQKVMGGKRYNVRTAILLASDEFGEGYKPAEKRGLYTFLYRTRGGAFFRVVINIRDDARETDTIEALTKDDAMELYESLPEQHVEYEKAFEDVGEADVFRRPAFFGEPMKQTTVWMPDTMITWLKAQPAGMGETLRNLITVAMDGS